MITSAATDPFAAIFAPPGATAPTGDVIATPGGGVFGTMVAAAPAASPVAAIAPPSFRGALMNATLPVGALVSTGTPAARPTIATLPWPGASPVTPADPMMSTAMVANAAPVTPAMIPAGGSPMAFVPIVTAGPLPASVAPTLPMRTDDAPTSLPPAIVRPMPAPAPSPDLRSAVLVASMPAAWPPAPAGVSALPVAAPSMPLVAAPQPDLVLRVAPDADPIGNGPLPAAPFIGAELPRSLNAAPVSGSLSGGSRSDVITLAAPLLSKAGPSASGKPALVAAPLPDLVLRPGPDAGPALTDPVPAMPLANSGQQAAPGKPALVAAPLPDLVLRPGPDAGPALTDSAPATPLVNSGKPAAPGKPVLAVAPLPDLALRADAEPALGDPMLVDAQAAAASPPVDRTATPLPTPTSTGTDVTKPSAPRKPGIAPAPVPVVFAQTQAPAQASPVVAPVAVKGPATPADPARAEDGVPVDAEDTDPASTPLPLTMAPPPVLPDPATSPLPEAATATPGPSAGSDAGSSAHGAPVAAPVTSVATPALGQSPATAGKIEASSDRPAAVAAAGLRPGREEAAPADPKPVTAATPDPRSFAALVEPKVAAPAPAPTTPTASPVPEARVAAEPGRMGHEMAVAIARHTAEGGGEALTVRLNPAEFGRIDVTLSFDDRGTLRAVLAAETPAALDLLRRDSADLGRALSDAGMRTDAQSFRFDTRQGGADAGGQGAQGQPRWQAAATPRNASTTTDLPEPEYRPLRSRGGVDLMA